MRLSLGNERATRQGTAGDRVNDSSFAPAVPTERLMVRCHVCQGMFSETRGRCPWCRALFYVLGEAAA